MLKILNPFENFKGYNCFGCSQHNSVGLKMQFYDDGNEIVSTWKPGNNYQGWNSILHGGIQCTLIDEIASWYVFVKLKTFGVTSHVEVKLKRPVDIAKGDISLRANLAEMKRNIAFIYVKLFDGENNLCADGTIQCYTFPQDKAVGNMSYPGYEKFINE
jgi:acyl-coenzyme A thioesterase PaaI-like protein